MPLEENVSKQAFATGNAMRHVFNLSRIKKSDSDVGVMKKEAISKNSLRKNSIDFTIPPGKRLDLVARLSHFYLGYGLEPHFRYKILGLENKRFTDLAKLDEQPHTLRISAHSKKGIEILEKLINGFRSTPKTSKPFEKAVDLPD